MRVLSHNPAPGSALATAVREVGYASAAYADALGEPVPLEGSGGHLVAAPVHGGGWDLAGPYPLLVLERWEGLAEDLDALSSGADFLAVVGVTDPFAVLDQGLREAAFPHLLRRWKDHHLADLSIDRDLAVAPGHRRKARRAAVDVEACDPVVHLEDWCRLYGTLIERHAIEGPQRFSRRIFSSMLGVPGLHAWRAHVDGATVGMVLVMVDGDRSWYHLGACSDAGYERGASFALFWRILDDLGQLDVRWLDLGAAAGAAPADPTNGLDRFKRGWATTTRPTWLGGRILDPDGYRDATSRTATADETWFPAYRAGAFS